MTDTRQNILKAVRKNRPAEVPLPSLDQDWIRYDDLEAQFAEVLTTVGGEAIPTTAAELQQHLDSNPLYAEADKICSLVEGIPSRNFDWSSIEDPHHLEDIDYAVLPASFAVAENGAVWVSMQNVRHRAIYFICQHFSVILPRREVVATMHDAYQRLQENRPEDAFDPTQPGFGVFISGPSKTADIEQSLVIGAHGPRSLSVFLVE